MAKVYVKALLVVAACLGSSLFASPGVNWTEWAQSCKKIRDWNAHDPISYSYILPGNVIFLFGLRSSVDHWSLVNCVGESGRVVSVATLDIFDLVKANSVDLIIHDDGFFPKAQEDNIFGELYRILKPGGCMNISDKIWPSWQIDEYWRSLTRVGFVVNVFAQEDEYIGGTLMTKVYYQACKQ